MGVYDKSSKWLIEHHGDALLQLAGVNDIVSWRPLPAELVQPAQLPDGILEVQVAGQPTADLFVVEMATFPERRVSEQVLRDAALMLLDRRVLPEVLVVVFTPRGKLRVASSRRLTSRLKLARLNLRWRVVELWNLSAEELLARQDPGMVPWVPLTGFEEPPADVLRRCRDIITTAAEDEQANLLAVTQVFCRLKFNDAQLLTILGGSEIMIESPLIQEIVAEGRQKDILRFLRRRFGAVPEETVSAVQSVTTEAELGNLVDFAADCVDIESFGEFVRGMRKF